MEQNNENGTPSSSERMPARSFLVSSFRFQVGNLNLNIHQRDLRQTDPKQLIYNIMSKWLPLPVSGLEMLCEKLSSPIELSESRVEKLMLTQNKKFSSLPEESQKLKKPFLECKSEDDVPVIVFISKMFADN